MHETEKQKLANAKCRELAEMNEYIIFTGEGWESSEYGQVESELANYLKFSLDGDEWMADTDKITAYVSTHRVCEHRATIDEEETPDVSDHTEVTSFNVVETPAGRLLRLGPDVIAAARKLKGYEFNKPAFMDLLEAVEAFDAG